MKKVTVQFEDSSYNYITSLSDQVEDNLIKEYFVGTKLNLGTIKDNLQTCIGVSIVDENLNPLNKLEIELEEYKQRLLKIRTEATAFRNANGISSSFLKDARYQDKLNGLKHQINLIEIQINNLTKPIPISSSKVNFKVLKIDPINQRKPIGSLNLTDTFKGSLNDSGTEVTFIDINGVFWQFQVGHTCVLI